MADVPGGSLHEIDSSITQVKQLLSMSSQYDHCRPKSLFFLALMRLRRHSLSNDREDLDISISNFTESILLPPLSWVKHGPIILDTLYFLACALLLRSKASKQSEDAIYAAKCLFHLRDRPDPISNIPRPKVTSLLVNALAWQVMFEAGNVMENIREMAVLIRELLTLESSDNNTTRLITLIDVVVMPNIRTGDPDQPLDELIECLRAARKHRPDLRQGRIAFARSLVARYHMTSVNNDYEEAASILNEIITSGNSQDKTVARDQELATRLTARLAMMRSITYQTPEYLEEAIFHTRACFGSSSAQEYFTSVYVDLELKFAAWKRFNYFGFIEGVEESSFHSLSSHSVPELQEIYQTLDKMESLRFGIRNNDDTTKINETIEKGRSILASSPNAAILHSFGEILDEAFWRTKKIEYLNESITSVHRQLITTQFPRAMHFITLPFLSQSLLARFHYFPGYCTRDLDEGLELLSQCASNAHARPPKRFKFACVWAAFARFNRHPSVSTAYKTTVSLMQDTLLFSPTLQLQHATLATDDDTHSLPLDYASYQVHHHQLEEAIETLEKGRALLWSEMRHFRIPIDQLLEVEPDLGHKFAAVNRDLEELTKAVAPSHMLSMDDTDKFKAVDPFGRLLLKQRGLLEERTKLILQIEALQSFDCFSTSPSFSTLQSAASFGPVIIINHSTWRSDILILLPDSPPSLITTADNFFVRARSLKDELLDARNKYGPDSDDYNQTLTHVLTELYDLVGKPVIERLRLLNIPEQSRVWWCPTSVFCSLPLHAMGPIPSDDGDVRYFLDIFVPSYTPTLSALIAATSAGDRRDPDRSTFCLPSLLLVAHFDVPSPAVSLSEVCEYVKVVQALKKRLSVKSLISKGATPTSVLDGLHDHQFVHFVCHGTLEARKPFDAGFELHGNERLTLLDIVRSRLPAAEFAFLSACHTAELTEGSSADEGLHLAAAVQYCGFRSVVGTMWAMANQDGPDVAKYLYQSMFPKKEKGELVPYYRRSAGALRDAVKKLRKERGITLERWVNFVHYGA